MNADALADMLDVHTPRFGDAVADWDAVLEQVRPRRRRGALALAVPALGAALTGLVLLWPFAAPPSVLAQALAAIGDKPVFHVVFADGLSSSVVDLRTGARQPAAGRIEIWSDPTRGVRVERSFRGQPGETYFVPASPLLPTFVGSYRAKLRAHAFHVTGSGSVGGKPVYWIESAPSWDTSYPSNDIHEYVEQIAISKATYKPVLYRTLRDGRVAPGSGTRVLSIETTAPQPQLFAHRRNPVDAGATQTSPPLTAAEARRRVSSPSLAPSQVAGIRRTWQGEPPFLAAGTQQLAGVELYFGPLSGDTGRGGLPGDPAYSGRFVAITIFPRPNTFTRQLGGGYFPPAGQAALDGPDVYGTGHAATLRAHGAYVLVEAGSDADALAAARAVSR